MSAAEAAPSVVLCYGGRRDRAGLWPGNVKTENGHPLKEGARGVGGMKGRGTG